MANPRRYVPVLGIVASLLVLGALALPFGIASGRQVGLYYASGAVNPLIAGLFALLSIVVFAAGRENRSDPALSAGVALTVGLFTVAISLLWAMTVRVDVLNSSLAASHPWGLVAVSLTLPLTAAWYARSLGVL